MNHGVLVTALALLLQVFALAFAALIDPYIRKQSRRLLAVIAVLEFTLLAQNLLDVLLQQRPDLPLLRIAVSVYGYCLRPVILVLFIRIVDPQKKQWPFWTLIGVNAAVYCTAFFSDIAFSFDDGRFMRGPLGLFCHFISLLLLAWHLVQVLKKYRNIRKPEALIPIINVAAIIAATVADTILPGDYPFGYLTVTLVSSSLFYYIWLHLQFVREHEAALMAQQRIQIMVSQIQPHFLYNTLSTIQALCRIDPEKAFDTLEKFGVYLRRNIDALQEARLIPFQKELEYTQIYAQIEMLRFPSIRIDYDIADDDFALPALTVQPMVENAIRHGVRIRDRGLVCVSTRRTADAHVIEIRDNGKGFDPEAAMQSEGIHIGIQNVRERLQQQCGGTLTIESRQDEGTLVTIRLPFGKEQL